MSNGEDFVRQRVMGFSEIPIPEGYVAFCCVCFNFLTLEECEFDPTDGKRWNNCMDCKDKVWRL
jgi:hypothetical protein